VVQFFEIVYLLYCGKVSKIIKCFLISISMNFNLMLLTVDKNVSKLIKIPDDGYFAETDKQHA
jgi:hypothetical protein